MSERRCVDFMIFMTDTYLLATTLGGIDFLVFAFEVIFSVFRPDDQK